MDTSRTRCRVAGTAEAEEVAELLDRFQREFDEPTPGAGRLVERVRTHVATELSVFVLAGPEHVGVAQLRFRDHLFTARPVCLLEEFYVVPEQRGRGHGSEVLDAAMRVARQRGAATMELGTAFSDSAARAVYEKFGFTNLEREGRPETRMLYYEREL
ncbi:Acetyltransferase (GNAT) family protein [Actinopolyspora xinjiangensis]|uniref:Acetyltransferase (GNAT) family protein n=1 Tax=Actinopolyspora xinjiangensis TaxID=405564 RepID=A0A1H0S098_9ACTN|nr:GNAT family N-acetyltransferase [Actinopolyspora xinjiangensis]SDP35251.1 Acetyltransferase (GNAT) family protein [Actinopolyspora xinjiangensis]